MSERIVIALSGVVGAGKSSAATAIVQGLQAAGCPAVQVRFQDFIGARARQPEAGRPRSGGHASGPAAEPASTTRWQGYRRRRLTAMIAAGHAWRSLLFRRRIRQWPSGTVLVFDRYFYDSLVHFDLSSAGWRLDLLLRSIPAPSISAFLLIRESTILDRRPRYSKEYARQVSAGYEWLAPRFQGTLVARTDDFGSVTGLASRIVADVLKRRDIEKSA